ncbi:DNA repair exonuclease [Candidatus Woesearchaeota archaeon]|nr:MAG: DNA repair exonuclease [Candidatus Woesearchaeota archaeon]
MKFAHMADCHIGSWRDPKLRDASTKAFSKAIDICLEEDVDFVLIAGDLFNTALPGVDLLKSVVAKLKELKDKGIPVYGIAGSHDFSPSGKTMIDVLENAGLFVNVCRGKVEDKKLVLEFTTNEKTGVKITGMLGKRGMLDRKFYEQLDSKSLERENGRKVFLFHTLLSELKPKDLQMMDSSPLSLLPKGFDYYAGGHPHFVLTKKEEGYGVIAYPGPLFPNSFKEMEDVKIGGFNIVEDWKIRHVNVQVYNVHNISVDCNHKTPEQVKAEILEGIKNKEFIHTIVTIRLFGVLESGKVSDIDFGEISRMLYEKSAFAVLRNTSGLSSKEFEEVKVSQGSVDEIEDRIIREHAGQISIGLDRDKEITLTKKLIDALNMEKAEGERTSDFEARVLETVRKVLE